MVMFIFLIIDHGFLQTFLMTYKLYTTPSIVLGLYQKIFLDEWSDNQVKLRYFTIVSLE
jgi:hypothetical protein